MISLHILDINPSSDIICKYFLLLCMLPFNFVDGFLCCAGAFYFDVVSLVDFCFCCFCFWYQIKKIIITRPMSRNSLPMFLSKNFSVSCLMFKYLIHFEGVWCKIVVQIHSFAYGCPVFPALFIGYTDILVQLHSLHMALQFFHNVC